LDTFLWRSKEKYLAGGRESPHHKQSRLQGAPTSTAKNNNPSRMMICSCKGKPEERHHTPAGQNLDVVITGGQCNRQ
jgi:hypothetical protein